MSGLFEAAQHKYLADMISIHTLGEARESIKKLVREYNQSATAAKKLRVARATMLAANRAKVLGWRNFKYGVPRATPNRRYSQVASAYRVAAKAMFEAYQFRKSPFVKKVTLTV